MDEYVEVEEISWFKRFRNAIGALAFAPVLMAVGFFMLRTGEIDHAKTTTALKEIISSIKEETSAKEGELFRFVGTIKAPNEPLLDKEFGVKTKAVKLYRAIYTYQWKEIKKKETKRTTFGGEKKVTTYRYEKTWSAKLIPSSKFRYSEGHENPQKKKYPPKLFLHQQAHNIGKYALDSTFCSHLQYFELLDLSTMPQLFNATHHLDTVNSARCPRDPINQHSYSSIDHASKSQKTSSIFIGEGTPQDPQVGDTRIEYWYIPVSYTHLTLPTTSRV